MKSKGCVGAILGAIECAKLGAKLGANEGAIEGAILGAIDGVCLTYNQNKFILYISIKICKVSNIPMMAAVLL
ncbi:MAG: hypothetical protein GY755_00175 [Chloroflexi bacterium]|nr:hypothetical protein [Chloroflexota bacterium]